MNPIHQFYAADWIPFDGNNGRLPPEKKLVAVLIESRQAGSPDCAAIGYMAYAAGVKDSPRFIVPGFPRLENELGMPILFTVKGWKWLSDERLS